MNLVATFSIVAYDAPTAAWGVAVQSRYLAAGSIVPWAKAGAGAVATQAFANPRYGSLGLAMLEQGLSAAETIAALVAGDPGSALRQVGVVDSGGQAAAHTGAECFAWAGHIVAENYCCQGNILAGPAVVRDMADTFAAQSDVAFPERLVAVLAAGQRAGGDTRGQQSAALLVVREGGAFAGYSDRVVDLRVDDHVTPIAELARLLQLHRETFGL